MTDPRLVRMDAELFKRIEEACSYAPEHGPLHDAGTRHRYSEGITEEEAFWILDGEAEEPRSKLRAAFTQEDS